MTPSVHPSTVVPGGFLIAFEGIDGAGKTHLSARVGQELARMGLRFVMGKEPTAGPWGMELRRSAATGRLSPVRELELLLADRREHVSQVIAPALARDEFVLLDRYYYSNAAYQGAEGLDVAEILAANEAFAPKADLVLLLDVPPEVGLARIRQRGDVANAFETVANLQRCRGIFLGMDFPGLRRIDATLDAERVLVEAMTHIIALAADKIARVHGLSIQAAEKVAVFTQGIYAQPVA